MKRKFGIADKLGYMFGDFGNDFAFILSSMFLLKFYTDVMGVSAAVVGTMMMAARLLDDFGRAKRQNGAIELEDNRRYACGNGYWCCTAVSGLLHR